MYEVLISHEAEKLYTKQDRDTKRRLNKCIDDLSHDPLFGPHIKKLHGDLKGKFRYRLGVNIKKKTVEIKTNELPRSKLRGIKNHENITRTV